MPIWPGLALYIRSWDFGAALPWLSHLHWTEPAVQFVVCLKGLLNRTEPNLAITRLSAFIRFLCGLSIYHLIFTAIVQYSIIFNSMLFHAKFWPKPCLIWASEPREFHPCGSTNYIIAYGGPQSEHCELLMTAANSTMTCCLASPTPTTS